MRNTILGLVTCCYTIVLGQSPILYDINSSGTNLFNSGQTTLTADKINIGASSYGITSGAQVTEIAKTQIYAAPGFYVDGLSSTGYADLHIDPGMFNIASFHPNGFTGISQYSRFEIGVEIPNPYKQRTLYYILAGGDPNLFPGILNPYDPDSIRVECEYSITTNTLHTYVRNGFYKSKDITVDTAQNQWVESTSYSPPYPFRVRFAPPLAGVYKGIVRLYYQNNLILTYPEFSFTVTSSSNPGHLSMSTNPKFQKMKYDNGQLFFALGRNESGADMVIANNPNNPNCSSISWFEHKSAPSSHREHRNRIRDLANNDYNFVRIRMDRTSFPVEETPYCNTAPSVYDLTNFSANEKFMWELDSTLAVCESIDIRVLLNIDLEADYDVINNNPLGWQKNPYCTLTGTTVSGRNDFFLTSTPKNIYKKRLKYIEARWGYSTSIAAWSLFNEVDNMKPSDTNLILGIQQWACIMRSLLQAGYPSHPVTMGTGIGVSDLSANPPTYGFNLLVPNTNQVNNVYAPCVDFYENHLYASEQTGNPWKYQDINEVVISKSQKFNGYWYYPITNKPTILGEYGMDPWKDINWIYKYSRLSPHNQNWGSLFANNMGIATQWWETHVTSDMKPLKAFVDRIDFNTLLLPDLNMANKDWRVAGTSNTPVVYFYSEGPSTSPIFTNWMKTQNSDTIYGWTRNASSNWMVDGYPNVVNDPNLNPNWDDTLAAYGYNGIPNPPSSPFAIFTIIQGLQHSKHYDVEIYDTWQPGNPLVQTITNVGTDQTGNMAFQLNMGYDYPPSNQQFPRPDYAFIARLSPNGGNRSFTQDQDSLTSETNETITFHDGKNGQHHWDFGNGETSSNPNPSVTYTESGVYTINHSVTDNGETKTESKEIVVISAQWSVNLYPVPARDKIYLNFKGNKPKNLHYFIINELGQTSEMSLNSDKSIDLTGLSQGIYLLKINSETESKTGKFVIAK